MKRQFKPTAPRVTLAHVILAAGLAADSPLANRLICSARWSVR
jgi:hypothetical protein